VSFAIFLCDNFSRVGARGVGGAYARTEAEFEQIIDGINEQEASCITHYPS